MLHAHEFYHDDTPDIEPRRLVEVFTGGPPMPATRDDIAKLRAVLYMLKNETYNGGPMAAVTRTETIHALERAIALLEEGSASSPVFWILGALSRAWTRKDALRFVQVDHDLNQWALEQIHQQLNYDDGPEENH